MKTARVIALTVVLLAMTLPAAAQTKGWGLGAGVIDGEFSAQVRKDFWLGGDLSQITGQVGIWFPGKTTFRIDADYHFMIKTSEGSTSRFYPLVGADFMLTESTAAFAELKYVASDWDGLGIHLGIYF